MLERVWYARQPQNRRSSLDQEMSHSGQDPRRAERVTRYKPQTEKAPGEDPIPEYMNLLAMVFSICGLMMKVGTCLRALHDGLALLCWRDATNYYYYEIIIITKLLLLL